MPFMRKDGKGSQQDNKEEEMLSPAAAALRVRLASVVVEDSPRTADVLFRSVPFLNKLASTQGDVEEVGVVLRRYHTYASDKLVRDLANIVQEANIVYEKDREAANKQAKRDFEDLKRGILSKAGELEKHLGLAGGGYAALAPENLVVPAGKTTEEVMKEEVFKAINNALSLNGFAPGTFRKLQIKEGQSGVHPPLNKGGSREIS